MTFDDWWRQKGRALVKGLDDFSYRWHRVHVCVPDTRAALEAAFRAGAASDDDRWRKRVQVVVDAIKEVAEDDDWL